MHVIMDNILDKINLNNVNWVNKYSIAVFLFVIWLGFFDKYNFLTQRHLSNTLNNLEERKEMYERQLETAIKEREVMNSDIEKYAREHYFMHKPNEKVFVIKEPEKIKTK